jgi:hypothetical protein
MAAAVSLIGTVAAAARAQDGHRDSHDWYRNLQTRTGGSCCNGDLEHGDCRPVRAYPVGDGQWMAFFGGRFQPVPPSAILPDELNRVPTSAHLCERGGTVYCFLKGGAGG